MVFSYKPKYVAGNMLCFIKTVLCSIDIYSVTGFALCRRKERKAFFQSPEAEKMNLWTEQLMVYFVYTYFCGGIYNENPYGKMKAAIVSTIMIQDMMMVHWKKHGTLTLKEAADVAHRYSREIEHSDENKGLLEETLTREEEFRLRALLAAL